MPAHYCLPHSGATLTQSPGPRQSTRVVRLVTLSLTAPRSFPALTSPIDPDHQHTLPNWSFPLTHTAPRSLPTLTSRVRRGRRQDHERGGGERGEVRDLPWEVGGAAAGVQRRGRSRGGRGSRPASWHGRRVSVAGWRQAGNDVGEWGCCVVGRGSEGRGSCWGGFRSWRVVRGRERERGRGGRLLSDGRGARRGGRGREEEGKVRNETRQLRRPVNNAWWLGKGRGSFQGRFG